MYLLANYLDSCGDSPFSLSAKGDEVTEPAGGTTADETPDVEEEADEVDPDDEEVDIDSDDEDEDAESEELHTALGGRKKPTRRDLKDPVHGAKYRTLVRDLKTTRRTTKAEQAALAAERQKLQQDRVKFDQDRATIMRDIQGRFTKAPVKADVVSAAGKGAQGQPAVAGKGAKAVEPDAKGSTFQLPQSQDELDTLLRERIAGMFGGLATEEETAAKAVQAEQAKAADTEVYSKHNEWVDAAYKRQPTKEYGALLTKANKEVFPTVFKDYRDEFVANQGWYTEFTVLLAQNPQMQGVYNTFARIPRGAALYKRKPADVIRDLEDTGRRWGFIEHQTPAATLPASVIEARRKAGKPLNIDATRDEMLELEKKDPAEFLRRLEANPNLSDLFPERWQVEQT